MAASLEFGKQGHSKLHSHHFRSLDLLGEGQRNTIKVLGYLRSIREAESNLSALWKKPLGFIGKYGEELRGTDFGIKSRHPRLSEITDHGIEVLIKADQASPEVRTAGIHHYYALSNGRHSGVRAECRNHRKRRPTVLRVQTFCHFLKKRISHFLHIERVRRDTPFIQEFRCFHIPPIADSSIPNLMTPLSYFVLSMLKPSG